MRYKTILFYLFGALALAGCDSRTTFPKPDDLIPRDQMVALLTDMYLAKNAPPYTKNASTVDYFSIIYKKYHVDSLQFKNSNFYYASKPVVYQKIYEEVIARLEDLKKKTLSEERGIEKKQLMEMPYTGQNNTGVFPGSMEMPYANYDNPGIFPKPDKLIPPYQMVVLLTNMYLAKNDFSHTQHMSPGDYFARIFRKYGVDSLQFEHSNFYYTLNPVIYRKIYEGVISGMETLKKETEKKKPLEIPAVEYPLMK